MNILVTGGAGFIGSHLVDTIIKDNDITVIDNLSTGRKDWLHKDIMFINDDIKQLGSNGFMNNYDMVYHLAANADVRGGYGNPHIDLEENVIGTHSVLEYMRKNDINKIVFTSSATVYGERSECIKEDTGNIQPISHYGASKLAAEQFICSYCNNYDIQAWIFRFNNIIGARNTHGVINDFVNKLTSNPKELEILGDGYQTKQYLHVSDCVRAIVDIPKKDVNNNFIVYNLSHDIHIKVKDLANLVVKYMNLDNVEYKFTGGDRGWIGDVPITILCNKKACDVGWYPKVYIEDAIKDTVRWLIDNK